MRRREFLALVGATAVGCSIGSHAWPLERKPPHVVILSPADLPYLIFRRHLNELGYTEGHNIQLDIRTTGGRVDRLPELAGELVQEGPIDAIVAETTWAAHAAHQATETIPVVALVAVDPVASGLVKSLAHPGGNVTGIAIFSEETSVKRVELMREVSPHAHRLAVITASAGNSSQNLRPVQDTGRKLDFTVDTISIDDSSKFRDALSPTALASFDAFILVPDLVLTSHADEVVGLIGGSNKPAIFPSRDWAKAGGFLSFGPDLNDSAWPLSLIGCLRAPSRVTCPLSARRSLNSLSIFALPER